MSDWSVAKRLVVLGLVVLFAGVAVGCIPVTSDGQDCGSAWAPISSGSDELNDLRVEYGVPLPDDSSCNESRSTSRNIALMVAGIGVLGIAGGWVAAGWRPSR